MAGVSALLIGNTLNRIECLVQHATQMVNGIRNPKTKSFLLIKYVTTISTQVTRFGCLLKNQKKGFSKHFNLLSYHTSFVNP